MLLRSLVLLCFLATVMVACSTAEDQECQSNGDFFLTKVWSPVISNTCIKCHAPDGTAVEKGAKFILQYSSDPGFLEKNLYAIEEMAKTEYEDVPLVLLKAVGGNNHGGGAVLVKSSDEYAALTEMVARVKAGESCTTDNASRVILEGLTLLDAAQTLRKASLHLAGRLPTSAELEQLERATDEEAALGEAIDALMGEDTFYSRLKELFNDLLLTDRFLNSGVNFVDENYAEGAAWFAEQESTEKKAAHRSVAKEPLELIAYLVKHDRPFTEVLTADYSVFNPYSAKIYGIDLSFQSATDETELLEGKLKKDGDIAIPHAGVLSSPMFLNRFPNTRTNRNRHRAATLYKIFLATDILKVAKRPIDPAQATSYNNPLTEDPSCTVCHKLIDPVASAFQNWHETDYERYLPDNGWYKDVFSPGFAGELMPTNEYGNALAWMGKKISEDPRFVLAMVQNIYRGLTGREPLSYPEDSSDPQLQVRIRAWLDQQDHLREIGEAFVASNYNLKTIFRRIILGPYYRASNTTGELGEDRSAELAAFGTGRLLIPEVLSRKIKATVGIAWLTSNADSLTGIYNIFYGGIDSNSVTDRLTTPNSLIANVAMRMANELACSAVSRDFWFSKDKRRLFPTVEFADAPLSAEGVADTAAIEKIKDNLSHLHWQILGERAASDSVELERSYALFHEVYTEGNAALLSETVSKNLPYSCRMRIDPDTGEDLAADVQIVGDELYTIRAWQAVLSYLLTDYRFLYE